jgi:hypothetical protein
MTSRGYDFDFLEEDESEIDKFRLWKKRRCYNHMEGNYAIATKDNLFKNLRKKFKVFF